MLLSQLYLSKECPASPVGCRQLMKPSSAGNLITPKCAMSFASNTAAYHHPPVFQAASSQCPNTYPQSYKLSVAPIQGSSRTTMGSAEEQSPTVITVISTQCCCAAASQDKLLSYFNALSSQEVYCSFIPAVD